ncbi:hypothetical protein DEV91_14033 [Phyllobacterium brassicacearum]|nr:hypothetical protein DEV91_14033 [Phyllobacterium brassicacearum]
MGDERVCDGPALHDGLTTTPPEQEEHYVTQEPNKHFGGRRDDDREPVHLNASNGMMW